MSDHNLKTIVEINAFIDTNASKLVRITKHSILWESLNKQGVADEYILSRLKIKRSFYLVFKTEDLDWVPYAILTEATAKLMFDEKMRETLTTSAVCSNSRYTNNLTENWHGISPAGREFEMLYPKGASVMYTYFPEAPKIR